MQKDKIQLSTIKYSPDDSQDPDQQFSRAQEMSLIVDARLMANRPPNLG